MEVIILTKESFKEINKMADINDPADDGDCFWFPDLAKCQDTGDQTPEENTETINDVDNEFVFEQELDPSNVIARMPILGNIAYISTALLAATAAGLRQFRWRADDDGFKNKYYAFWTFYEADLGSTNYWELGTLIADFGMLGIFGVAFVTEILATFGIAPELNVMVWAFGVGLGGLVIGLTYNIMMFMAINTCYGINSDSSKATSATYPAGILMQQIQFDWLMSNAAAAMIGWVLFSAYGNWWESMDSQIVDEDEEMKMEEETAAVEEETAVEEEVIAGEGEIATEEEAFAPEAVEEPF